MAQRVVITGANRGIGLALTKAYLDKGDTVVAGCRKPAEARKLAELKQPDDERLLVVRLEVNSDQSVGYAVRQVAERMEAVDLLINNAAVGSGPGGSRLAELDIERCLETIRTNSYGPLRVARAFLPLLKKGRRPRIVNISSGAGRIATRTEPGMYDYGASKAALNFLTRSMAAELRDQGIIVVAMSPGWVKTDMGGPNATIEPPISAEGIARTADALQPQDTSLWFTYEGKRNEQW